MAQFSEKLKGYFTAPETQNYTGWLVSSHFYKRLLAFMGYTILALFSIELLLLVLSYCVSAVRGLFA